MKGKKAQQQKALSCSPKHSRMSRTLPKKKETKRCLAIYFIVLEKIKCSHLQIKTNPLTAFQDNDESYPQGKGCIPEMGKVENSKEKPNLLT